MIHKKLKDEQFEPKSYLSQLNIYDGRIKFRTRVQLIPGLKYLYKNDRNFAESMWSCPLCEKFGQEYSLDNYSHSLTCIYLEDLRSNRNLLLDQDLCSYIKDVLKRREELSET